MNRNLLFFTLIIFFFTISVKAQNWQKINPYPTVEQVERLYFYNSSFGIGGGNNGVIIRTTDGGLTWSEVLVSSNYDGIKDASFTSATTGYTCGYQLSIYKTTDAGLTWTTLTRTPGSNKGYWHILFTDANTGYVAGDEGIIKKTTDAGITWTTQNSGVSYLITKLVAINSTTIVGVGYGSNNYRVLKTTNGGTTWTEKNSGSTSIFLSACYAGSNIIYAGNAAGAVYKSTDAGETWSTVTSPTTKSIYGLYFISTTVGFVCDQYGHLFKTTNGGTSWNALTNGVPDGIYLYGLWFTNSNIGFASGSSGILLKTTDGGGTWASVSKGTEAYIAGAWFTDANTGYIGDMFTPSIYKSINGGIDWTKLNTGTTGGIFDLYFPDANTGYGCTDAPAFIKTTNAGGTWTQVSLTSLLGSNVPFAISFPAAATGYMAAGPIIIKTTNSGTDWTSKKSDFSQSLNSCYFVDANTGFVAGAEGFISKTTDGGSTWTTQTSNTSNILYSIAFVNHSTGFACGDAGTLLKTTNGGTTWSKDSLTIYTLYKVKILSASAILTCGSGGVIFQSADGGDTWTGNPVGGYNNLYTICNYGSIEWAMGDQGFIYKNNIPLPVELSSFNAKALGRDINLYWSTESEINCSLFMIEKKSGTGIWKVIQKINASGNSYSRKSYSFTDKDAAAEIQSYRLKIVDNDGSFRYSSIINVEATVVVRFSLEQNYPNPFNPVTNIRYSVSEKTRVTLTIYNMMGEKVEVLADRIVDAGLHTVNWNAERYPSGVYCYELKTDKYISVKKLTLIK